MADIETTPVESAQTEIEQGVEQTTESVEGSEESTETTEETQSAETTEDGPVTWSEFAKDFGDDYKDMSPEDLIESHKTLKQQIAGTPKGDPNVESLKAELAEIKSMLSGRREPAQTGADDGYYVSQVLNNAVRSGQIDPETAQQYAPIAQLVDQVLNKAYAAMYTLANKQEEYGKGTPKMVDRINSIEWGNFRHAKYFERKELDEARQRFNLDTYQDAAKVLTAVNPGKYKAFVDAMKAEGAKEGIKKYKQVQFQRGGRGGGEQMKTQHDWHSYRSGDGGINQTKLDFAVQRRLITEQQRDAICDKIIGAIQKGD